MSTRYRNGVVATVFILLHLFAVNALAESSAPRTHVKALKITVLSTMLADAGIGEWGYAALVEVDGQRLLFDSGARPETVLTNAREMGIDLSNIDTVVLSHNHADHTGGLLTLRRELRKKNPNALRQAHAGEGIFLSRKMPDGQEGNNALLIKSDYEKLGGQFVVHAKPFEILPGVWFTGPVPRIHPEKNYPLGGKVITARGEQPDDIPEDGSLIFATDEGLVVLTGCGHAGIVNTVDHARHVVEAAPLLAVIGGLHTFNASDEVLAWTAQQLKAAGLRYLLAGHCTGIEAAFRLRELAGLNRQTAVVSSVGSSFKLGVGIDPRALAR